MIFAGILAGGKGTRMNITNMPKQFLMLGSKPIIIHTVEKFLLCNRIDVVYLGVHKDWMSYCEELIEKYVGSRKDKIKIVAGGEDRNGTIMNIIKDIEENYKNVKESIIITHDAVRPFVSLKIIEENIEAVITYGACDTVIPATDTIVKSENGKDISEIPNRKFLYQGQTPQSFRIEILKELYSKISEADKKELTDACKICVLNGKNVKLVNGGTLNIKITTINDYTIAQAILSQEG